MNGGDWTYVSKIEGGGAEVAANRLHLRQEGVAHLLGNRVRDHEKVLDDLDQHVPVHFILLRKALQSSAS